MRYEQSPHQTMNKQTRLDPDTTEPEFSSLLEKYLESVGVTQQQYEGVKDLEVVSDTIFLLKSEYRDLHCISGIAHIVAPKLESVEEEQFADSNIQDLFCPKLRSIQQYGFLQCQQLKQLDL